MINVLKDTTLNKLTKEKKDNLKNTYEIKITEPPILVAILTPAIEIKDILEQEPLP